MLKSTSTLIPLNLTGVTSNQLLDTTMLCSTCISGGLLTSVYNRGREERLHGPLGIITFITTFAIYITTRVPLDILVFVIFPWTLTAALLVSRIYSPIVHANHASALEFSSRKEREESPRKWELGLNSELVLHNCKCIRLSGGRTDVDYSDRA